MKKRKYNYSGFTLVELLVAMMVTAIILSAVATLAFAMGSANDSSDATSQKQAHVRFTTVKASELIRHCKLVVLAGPGEIALWRADDDGNNRINLEELVYIDSGANGERLRLAEFVSMSNSVVPLSQIRQLQFIWWEGIGAEARFTDLIPVCSNVQFYFDAPAMPPTRIKLINISFDIFENGVNRNYQINASLRNWAGNLLSPAGDMIVSDDD